MMLDISAHYLMQSLMHDWLTEFFERSLRLNSTDFTYGTSLVGSTRIFAALDPFYQSYFNPRTAVLPNHLVCSNGLTTMIDTLATVICDRGEAWLLPTPFYNAFPDDLMSKAGVEVVRGVVPEGTHGELGEVEALERVMQARKVLGGAAVRAVLVTNPHNPLGFCYRKEILEEYVRFAERWDLYLILDEIYALSIYVSDLSPVPFTSILSIDVEALGCNPARIVQLYGMSKDFGSNGFRVGVMVTQHNPVLHGAMSSYGMLMKIGSPVDALWSGLLSSSSLPTYLKLNQERLASAYEFVTTWLRTHRIPYRPCHAGHFILIDLRGHLPHAEPKLKAELALLGKFVDAGVYLGPGFSYAVETEGFFRLTFSIKRELLLVGLARIEEVLRLT
ncbi:hypothetical protein P7C70_g6555, partial [Phenoliferia sp. Uapishka_3]